MTINSDSPLLRVFVAEIKNKIYNNTQNKNKTLLDLTNQK